MVVLSAFVESDSCGANDTKDKINNINIDNVTGRIVLLLYICRLF